MAGLLCDGVGLAQSRRLRRDEKDASALTRVQRAGGRPPPALIQRCGKSVAVDTRHLKPEGSCPSARSLLEQAATIPMQRDTAALAASWR